MSGLASILSHPVFAGIVSGLVVAAAIGIFAVVRRRVSGVKQRKHPVVVTATPIVRAPWAVALPGELPDAAAFEASQPSCSDPYRWLRNHGAVDHRETRLQLSLRSETDELIVVRDIRVAVERSVPLAGTWVYCPTAGANAATLLVFDLDEDAPAAWKWAEDGTRRRVGNAPFFERHNVTIPRGGGARLRGHRPCRALQRSMATPTRP